MGLHAVGRRPENANRTVAGKNIAKPMVMKTTTMFMRVSK
jgi:hypothetical protein